MTVTQLHADNFESTLKSAQQPVVVDFYAQWCGPCRALAPVLEDLAQKLKGRISIYKANVDELPEQAQKYGIRGVPTLIVFKGGNEIDRITGALPKDQLSRYLEGIRI